MLREGNKCVKCPVVNKLVRVGNGFIIKEDLGAVRQKLTLAKTARHKLAFLEVKALVFGAKSSWQ